MELGPEEAVLKSLEAIEIDETNQDSKYLDEKSWRVAQMGDVIHRMRVRILHHEFWAVLCEKHRQLGMSAPSHELRQHLERWRTFYDGIGRLRQIGREGPM
ncbi:MAG TPA: hypothetical protein VMU13_03105 [Candidatus Paceibacterota bacterium]|nr:hypothetical protein [Candidatus Paceibacterota bacterium]